jgi:prophage regulatory protein
MNPNYVSDKYMSVRFSISRQTIWRLVKADPKFPKPVKLSAGCTRWQLSEVEAWAAQKRSATKK